MKKITLFALVALSLTLASCNKEQILPASENGNTITMTLNASVEQTKATISDEWKFAFTQGDNISLTNNQATGYYTVTCGSDGKFTGTVTAPQSEATWYAYYPSNNVSFANQTGTQAGASTYYAYSGKQENVAAGSKTLDITLNPQTAILVITSKRASLDINVKTSDGKWVSGLTAKSGDATFGVTTSDTKVSLLKATEAGKYYVVVPAGVQIAIYDGDLKVKETKDAGLTAGRYYEITIELPTIADVLATVDGGFPGGTSNKNPSGDAWVCGSDRYTFVYGSTLMFYDSDYVEPTSKVVKGNATGMPLTTNVTQNVTQGENCYTATYEYPLYITLKFNMTAGKLTSINFSSTDDSKQENYGGTYTAPGVFSVSASKKVCFSKGNLWYGKVEGANDATWNFETNQYDFTPNINGEWDESHISNFYWSQTAFSAYAEYYDNVGSTEDVLFTNEDGFTVNGMTNFWRTLSQAEWQYLLDNHQYKYLSVNGKYGIAIAPDGFSGTIADSYSATTTITWATAEAAGLVFLPSTGFRWNSGEIDQVSGDIISCIYWTSTAKPDDEYEAYRMFFQWDGSELTTDFNSASWREYAVGIRLVTDVPASKK